MEAILHIGIAQSFFAAFVLFAKRPSTLADRVLAVWFVIIGISMIKTLLFFFYGYGRFSPGAIAFTYGPFLYLYVKNVVFEKPRFKIRESIHFIPFVVSLILSYFFEWARFTQKSLIDGELKVYGTIYGLIFTIFLIYYVTKVFFLLKNHSKNIENNFSYLSPKITLAWVKYITIVFTLSFLTAIVIGIINMFHKIHPLAPGVLINSGFTLLAFSFSYYAFYQPGIFKKYKDIRYDQNIQDSDEEKTEEVKPQPKYERSGLKDEDSEVYLDKIKLHLEEDKPYLRGDLTINEMSETLDIPKHFITQIINEKLNKNFYTLINEYRLEAVKQMIVDPKYDKYTLLAIAYECGFNSKSSFNNIFKKATGKTPTQYRKELI